MDPSGSRVGFSAHGTLKRSDFGIAFGIPAPGTTMGVTVSLMHRLTASTMVIAVLHLEDNHNTTFDFPDGDQEAKVGGAVVEIPIQVNVP